VVAVGVLDTHHHFTTGDTVAADIVRLAIIAASF
jgi:hypothetical protein